MPVFLIAVILMAIVALHLSRPDITIGVTTSVLVPVKQWISIIPHGITAAKAILKDLAANSMLGVDRLQSLPWEDYYTQAATFLQSIESWSTLLEEAFDEAGYPLVGRCVHVAIYIGAALFVWTLATIIRWVVSIIWAVIAWIMGTVWSILWIMVYPLRFIVGLSYRLCIGRPLAASVGHDAEDHSD